MRIQTADLADEYLIDEDDMRNFESIIANTKKLLDLSTPQEVRCDLLGKTEEYRSKLSESGMKAYDAFIDRIKEAYPQIGLEELFP